MLDKYKEKSILLVGDLKAKSMLWGNPLHASDDRVDHIVEFYVENDLLILNDPLSEETVWNTNAPAGLT